MVVNTRWFIRRTGRFLAILALAGAPVAAGSGVASASTCLSWTGTQPVNPGSAGDGFDAVSMLSPCNVWAVGTQRSGSVDQTLAEHWDGTAWTAAPSSNPGGSSNDADFTGVAARSSAGAWAVGTYFNGRVDQTLIELLSNGTWEQVSSPDPGGSATFNALNGVAVTSAKDAWAVGDYIPGSHKPLSTLIAHWNGLTWSQVPSPSPGVTGSALSGVAATSAKNAWAVGYYTDAGSFGQTLIEHWDGTKWKRVPSPDPGGLSELNTLYAVAANSSSSAWAVGAFTPKGGSSSGPLILHWNGTTWKRVLSASLDRPAQGALLQGVAIVSGADAWAVGDTGIPERTLIAHWNGRTWSRVRSPNQGSSLNELRGIAASSPADVWAVGFYDNGGPSSTFAVHCC